MTRLIDAEELMEWADNWGETIPANDLWGKVRRMIVHDTVPVIRCKECKYAKKIYIKNLPWLKQWEYSCGYFNTHSVIGDDFCSRAERKEE